MFDKNPKYNPKQRHFALKKKRQDDVLFGHYSLSFHFLHRKANQVIYFAGVFNVSNLHQIWQNLYETNHLTSLYAPIWSLLAH
jgi:hypothetical protein